MPQIRKRYLIANISGKPGDDTLVASVVKVRRKPKVLHPELVLPEPIKTFRQIQLFPIENLILIELNNVLYLTSVRLTRVAGRRKLVLELDRIPLPMDISGKEEVMVLLRGGSPKLVLARDDKWWKIQKLNDLGKTFSISARYRFHSLEDEQIKFFPDTVIETKSGKIKKEEQIDGQLIPTFGRKAWINNKTVIASEEKEAQTGTEQVAIHFDEPIRSGIVLRRGVISLLGEQGAYRILSDNSVQNLTKIKRSYSDILLSDGFRSYLFNKSSEEVQRS